MKVFFKKEFLVEQVCCFFEFGLIVLVSIVWGGQCNLMMMGWYMVMGFLLLLVVIYLWDVNYSYVLVCGSGECVINVFGVELFDIVVDIGNCSGCEVDKFVCFGFDVLFVCEVGVLLVG